MIIFKYLLDARFGKTITSLPKYANFLTIGVQDEGIVLWALVDQKQSLERCAVHILPTGRETTESTNFYEYVGTVQIPNPMAMLVYHVFIERGVE